MIGVLHPCPGCGHDSMDQCWRVSSELTPRNRRICVECHDDCLPRLRSRSRKAASLPTKKIDPKDLHRLLFVPSP